MTEKIKNALGIAIIAGIVLAAAALVWYASSYARETRLGDFRSFAVTAEGRRVTVPDIGEFTFSVLTQGGKNISSLQKDNTTAVNKIIDYVKGQGIAAADIKTQNYSLQPRYEYRPCAGGGVCPPPAITGYEISQTVQVKIRDFDKIGDVLAGSVQNGANSVSQLTFTVDDPVKLQDEARAEAMTAARERALAIARVGGFSLGRLISIDEGGGPVPLDYAYGRGGDLAQKEALAAAPVIEPGSQEIKVSVTLRYEIE